MNLRPFRRVLIANRGEIAVRIIRGCHERGLEAVAIYSEADASSLHVRLADDAYLVGPPPSSASYLRVDAVLAVAERAGCDAVHPGYGFLSENAEFAQAVLDRGLVWIGPPPSAIVSMGSKTGARQAMHAAGVPIVPGTLEAIADLAAARGIAVDIGFPIMLKASAGGGGKGMRRVDDVRSLDDALAAAQSESRKSFGDDAVYIEKLIEHARHVEIQVLADGHGSVVHLFERDCSIQRRHQKVIEESPCPALPPATREAMSQAAVRAARAVDYVGVGTCEFLLGADGAFHFLEMNTRLQVEHPITEMVTGVDLVHAQLRVAAGEPLWLEQDDLQLRGHAIECRIYAEDPAANFRPSPGPLHVYREPAGPWVRVDSGVVEGMEVPIHYDPMIAKLVVWGEDRATAIARARRALVDYRIVGIPTSIPFFLALFEDDGFNEGTYDTGFITPEWLEDNLSGPPSDELLAVVAAISRFERDHELGRASQSTSSTGGSAWRRPFQWRTMNRGMR
jgi:acetyl-CoA carboxylase biotin carboxylase subunit